jgi:hypothetical protein
MSEAVQSSVCETNLIVLRREDAGQRTEDIPYQCSTRDVWTQDTALGTVKDSAVHNTLDTFKYFP